MRWDEYFRKRSNKDLCGRLIAALLGDGENGKGTEAV